MDIAGAMRFISQNGEIVRPANERYSFKSLILSKMGRGTLEIRNLI